MQGILHHMEFLGLNKKEVDSYMTQPFYFVSYIEGDVREPACYYINDSARDEIYEYSTEWSLRDVHTIYDITTDKKDYVDFSYIMERYLKL